MQTNVHFPADLNLLWDALRKGLDTIEKLQQEICLKRWRKIKFIYRSTKSIFRKTSQQVFRGKNEEQKKQAVQQYLSVAKKLKQRFSSVILHLSAVVDEKKILNLIAELCVYNEYVKKQINLIERRLLFGETIKADEKIHSVFEPHTEWIQKGKHCPSVELGHLLLITTDQYQFIVDYKVMEKEKDGEQVESLMDRLHIVFPVQKIYSHSFDKVFSAKPTINV
ncbi:MAG: hypothetical protein V1781_03710 [Bacteroidota bacterium]